MRSLAACFSAAMRSFAGHCAASALRYGRRTGRKPKQMADGVDEVGAVQRVEVELGDAPVDQAHDLLGGDRGGHEVARLLVVIQAFESVAEPVRHAGAGFGSKASHLLEIMDGDDAGHDGDGDAAIAHAVEIAEEHLVVEEELGDGASMAPASIFA